MRWADPRRGSTGQATAQRGSQEPRTSRPQTVEYSQGANSYPPLKVWAALLRRLSRAGRRGRSRNLLELLVCLAGLADFVVGASGQRNADLREADALRRNGHALVFSVLNHQHRGGETATVDRKRYLPICRLAGDGSAGVIGSLLPDPRQIGALR